LVLCYTNFEFEEVGLLEAIQPYRLLSVQLTPSNPKYQYRSKLLTVRLPDRFASAQRQL